ncbi:MAG: lipoprotein [Tepidimonas taiwanensis]|nr:lipoprotein [Tepidimonas taiwanensis]
MLRDRRIVGVLWWLCAAGLALSLSGCGQKGPLTLPPEPATAAPPTGAPTAAADAASDAAAPYPSPSSTARAQATPHAPR